jgi:hypothetical protein
LNLKTRTKHLQKTQSASHLPLFPWRAAVFQPSTRAGLHLSRQYRLRPAIADLIAALAGLGSVATSAKKEKATFALAANWPPAADLARETGHEGFITTT